MSKVTSILCAHYDGIDRPPVYLAFVAGSDGGETVNVIDRDAFIRLWKAGQTEADYTDENYMAFDPDHPIEWDDVMSESRGL